MRQQFVIQVKATGLLSLGLEMDIEREKVQLTPASPTHCSFLCTMSLKHLTRCFHQTSCTDLFCLSASLLTQQPSHHMSYSSLCGRSLLDNAQVWISDLDHDSSIHRVRLAVHALRDLLASIRLHEMIVAQAFTMALYTSVQPRPCPSLQKEEDTMDS